MLAVVLCFSVLGIQSVGLFHGVTHSNQEQHAQSSNVFDGIEKAFGSDPQKSNQLCKLLDSLILGAVAVSQNLNPLLLSFSQVPPAAVIQAGLAFQKLWPYQSQAPPRANPQ